MKSGSMCIDAQLFLEFFNDNNSQRKFMDFLEYVYMQYPNMIGKKDGKITAVCADIDIETKIACDIACDGIVFKEKVKFDKCEFKGKISFKNCTFKKQVIFSNSSFEYNVYFNNSTFEDYADFHECEFEKVACFYGVKFQKVPNFSTCYFKEQKAVNLVNMDINNLDFRKVEKFINENYKDKAYQEDQSEKKEQKYKLRYAQNAKDSFRIIKDVLIEQNNILEAQEWHKLELYAREKELEISLEKNNPIQSSSKLEKKEKFKKITLALVFNAILTILNNIKDKIGYFIEHIPIFFGCLLFCCILFPMLLFGLIMQLVIDFFAISFYITLNLLIQENFLLFMTRFIKYKTIKIYRIGKNMRDFTTWMNFALLYIYRNTSDHHTNFVKILNFTVGMIALYGIIIYIFYFCFGILIYSVIFFIPFIFFIFVLLILYLFFITFNNEKSIYFAILIFCFWGGCFALSMSLHSYIFSIEMFFLYPMSILLFYHLFTCKIKLIVFTLRLVSYLGLLYIIIAHHQFINPFIGIFSNDKLFESKFEQKLSDLNSSTIINLAKLSQKEFTLQDDYNVSFAELNSAKMMILSNKNNITALKDENLTKAAEILGDALYSEISQAIEQDRILGDIIKSTSVIYGIILLLCIFSLQKTARKNSIIPS